MAKDDKRPLDILVDFCPDAALKAEATKELDELRNKARLQGQWQRLAQRYYDAISYLYPHIHDSAMGKETAFERAWAEVESAFALKKPI